MPRTKSELERLVRTGDLGRVQIVVLIEILEVLKELVAELNNLRADLRRQR